MKRDVAPRGWLGARRRRALAAIAAVLVPGEGLADAIEAHTAKDARGLRVALAAAVDLLELYPLLSGQSPLPFSRCTPARRAEIMAAAEKSMASPVKSALRLVAYQCYLLHYDRPEARRALGERGV